MSQRFHSAPLLLLPLLLGACSSTSVTSPPRVPAPTTFTANAKPGYVELHWQMNSQEVQGFVLYRETLGKTQQSGVKKQALAILTEVEGNTRTYRDLQVVPGTQYRYAVAAKDSKGQSVLVASGSTSPASNQPPTVQPVQDLQATVGDAPHQIHASALFADEEGPAALQVTVKSTDSKVATAEWTLQGLKIQFLAAGTTTLTLQATDPAGLKSTAAFQVQVKPGNTPPTTTGMDPIAVRVSGGDYNTYLDLVFQDAEDGQNLNLTLQNNSNPTVLSATLTAGRLSITPLSLGKSTLTLRATDSGGLHVETPLQVTVVPGNRAPTALGIPDQEVLAMAVPSSLKLGPFFADPDQDTATLKYSVVSNQDPTVAFVSVTGDTLFLSGFKKGTTQVQVEATDDQGAKVTDTFQLTVQAANTPPVARVRTVDSQVSTRLPLLLDFSQVTDDVKVEHVKLDFGDGTSAVVSDLKNLHPHHYQKEGDYQIQAVATDNEGLTDTWTLFVKVGNHLPDPFLWIPALNLLPEWQASWNNRLRVVQQGDTLVVSGPTTQPDHKTVAVLYPRMDLGHPTSSDAGLLAEAFDVTGAGDQVLASEDQLYLSKTAEDGTVVYKNLRSSEVLAPFVTHTRADGSVMEGPLYLPLWSQFQGGFHVFAGQAELKLPPYGVSTYPIFVLKHQPSSNTRIEQFITGQTVDPENPACQEGTITSSVRLSDQFVDGTGNLYVLYDETFEQNHLDAQQLCSSNTLYHQINLRKFSSGLEPLWTRTLQTYDHTPGNMLYTQGLHEVTATQSTVVVLHKDRHSTEHLMVLDPQTGNTLRNVPLAGTSEATLPAQLLTDGNQVFLFGHTYAAPGPGAYFQKFSSQGDLQASVFYPSTDLRFNVRMFEDAVLKDSTFYVTGTNPDNRPVLFRLDLNGQMK